MYHIIEEVPGVPKSEQYFVTGPGIEHPFESFETVDAAKSWCDAEGKTPYKVRHFEP